MFKQEKYLDYYQKEIFHLIKKNGKTIYGGCTTLTQYDKNETYKMEGGHGLPLPINLNTSFFFNKSKTKPSLFLMSRQPTNKPKKKLPLLSFLLPLANLFTHPKTNPFLLFLGGFYSHIKEP